MEINVSKPKGHTIHIEFQEKELLKLDTILNKLIPDVEKHKEMGFASKKRLKTEERELFFELTDKINSVSEYIRENE